MPISQGRDPTIALRAANVVRTEPQFLFSFLRFSSPCKAVLEDIPTGRSRSNSGGGNGKAVDIVVVVRMVLVGGGSSGGNDGDDSYSGGNGDGSGQRRKEFLIQI